MRLYFVSEAGAVSAEMAVSRVWIKTTNNSVKILWFVSLVSVTLYKKWSFSSMISSVNVANFVVFCGFSLLLKKSFVEYFIFRAVLTKKLHLKNEKNAVGKFSKMKLTAPAARNEFGQKLSICVIVLKTSLINYWVL